MTPITFKPRWREELEAITDEGKLIFEFTIGQFHVFSNTGTMDFSSPAMGEGPVGRIQKGL